MTEGQVYKFGAHKLDDAVNRIEKANRRLAKVGLSGFDFTTETYIASETQENGLTVDKEMITLTLSAPAISFGGYSFLARLEALENGEFVTAVIPGQELNGYKPETMICEHCKINRQRNKTYLLGDESGKITQVGSSCLELFLGVAPQGLWALEYELTDSDSDGESEWGMNSAPSIYSTVEIVAAALAVSDMGKGFLPKSYPGSTAEALSAFIFPTPKEAGSASYYDTVQVATDPATIDLAKAIIEFAKNINGYSDYATNLRAVAAQEKIVYKHSGLLISAIGAYNKDQGIQAERKIAVKRVNELLAPVGSKVADIKATVTYTHSEKDYRYNRYGTTKTTVRFLTESGYALTWFASNDVDVKVGDTVMIKSATVKSEYRQNDSVSTTVKLVKFDKIEEK